MPIWKKKMAGKDLHESSQLRKAEIIETTPYAMQRELLSTKTINFGNSWRRFIRLQEVTPTLRKEQLGNDLPSKREAMLKMFTKQPIQKHLDDNKRIN